MYHMRSRAARHAGAPRAAHRPASVSGSALSHCLKSAARAVVSVMREVRSSKNVRNNVKKLKALFEIAQGTSYQEYVERQLDHEVDKLR